MLVAVLLTAATAVTAGLATILDGLLVRPFSGRSTHELHVVGPASALQPERPGPISPTEYLRLHELTDDLFVYVGGADQDDPATGGTRVVRVSEHLPSVVGVSPQLGRWLTERDVGSPGFVPIVISDRLWRARFGRDPEVVGAVRQMEGRMWQVLGIMSPGFDLPLGADAWALNSTVEMASRPSYRYLTCVVRLTPEVKAALASSPFADYRVQPLRQRLPLTGAVPAGVLFALCLLALAAGGWVIIAVQIAASGPLLRECRVRVALGATPARALWAVTGPGIGLCALSQVAGVLLGPTACRLVLTIWPAELTNGHPIISDLRGRSFAVLLAATYVVMVSALPLLWRPLLARAPLAGLGAAQSSTAKGVVRLWWVALCLVSAGSAFGGILSVGLGTDRWEAATADVGLNRIGLLAVSIAGPAASADSRVTELAARTLQGHDAVEQVSPGRAPIQRGGLLGSLAIDSAIDTDGARTVTVLWAQQGYFDTLGIRVLRGLAHDVDQLELAIVLPERVARTLQVDVGDLVRLNGFTHEVVAIVSDTYGEGPLAAPDAVVYVRPGGPFSEWVVRVRPAGQTSVDNLRSALAPLLGPRQRLEIVDIDRLLRERLAPYTSLALLVWAVAGLTLGLACCALIVAARTSVEQSSREWAIRLALGARHRDVKWLLYWRLVLPVVLGALLGVVGLGLLVTFSGGTGLQWPSAGWIAVLVGMALTVTPALLTVLVTSAGFRHMAIAQHLQP